MKFFKMALIALLALACTSCTQNKKTDLPQITFGTMSSMDYLPLAVAQREGYFEKEGIKVDLQKFLSANDRDAAIQGGAVDGAITDYTSAALVNAAGFDIKITSKCQAPFYIITGENSGISTLNELKGKKVAVSQNTVIDFCVDMALESAGMSASDIEKVEVNKIPLRLEMMRNNKIDATGLPNPFALIAQNDGCKALVLMEDLGYTVTGIIFSQKVIDEKGADTIKKFYRAYNEGANYLRTHSVEDIKDILTKDLGFPEPLLGQVQIPNYTNATAVQTTDKDIIAVIEWLTEKSLINDSFDANNLVNTGLVKTEE